MRTAYATVLSSLLLLGGGCDQKQKRPPRAVGGQGEVLVVMHQGHWEAAPGAAVRELLERPLGRLPQREPRFKIAHTTPEAFGTLLSTHHHVLKAEIGPDVDTTGVRIYRDRLAIGQLLVRIVATDPQEWIALLGEQGDAFIPVFEEHQRNRIIARITGQQDAGIVAALRERHGMSLDVPTGYRIAEETPEFVWLQRDRLVSGSGLEHNVIEGLFMYHRPYTSDSIFTVEQLVEQRDAMTRAHVKGPTEGSYMIVQRGFDGMDLMPEGRTARLNGGFAYLMHGLYGMDGARMGGPFVSLTTVDEARGRLVTVEGFVYAPQFDKREYMRELEAILFTLKFEPAS